MLPRSAVSGILDTQKKPHWFYITAGDQHVHHLSVDVTNSWIDEDLTKLAGGQPALGPLTSFIDAKGMHVAYIGTDSDIHISAFVQDGIKIGSERWVDQNLTTTTTGPQAATGSNISSFVDGYGDHIIYVASPSHSHRLIFADGKWTDIDLTDTPSTPGPQVVEGSALTSFGDGYGDHYVYLDGAQHIHQVYYDNAAWVDQDLTGIATPVEEAAVPAAAKGSALSSMAGGPGELIFYISANQHAFACFLTVHLVWPLAVACPRWRIWCGRHGIWIPAPPDWRRATYTLQHCKRGLASGPDPEP